MVGSFVWKIQKSVSLCVARRPAPRDFNEDQPEAETGVPDDVMEGHFAVLAIKGEETKRFIVELGYLTDPAFLGLLDRAREEYGFMQKGALAVPCRPQELQKILDDRRRAQISGTKVGGSFGEESNMFRILSIQTVQVLSRVLKQDPTFVGGKVENKTNAEHPLQEQERSTGYVRSNNWKK